MAVRHRATSRLRGNGMLSLVAGLASALALTGAAVYTVEGVPCADGGQYVRHAQSVELIGGCVDGTQLPHSPANNVGSDGGQGSAGEPRNYQP